MIFLSVAIQIYRGKTVHTTILIAGFRSYTEYMNLLNLFWGEFIDNKYKATTNTLVNLASFCYQYIAKCIPIYSVRTLQMMQLINIRYEMVDPDINTVYIHTYLIRNLF